MHKVENWCKKCLYADWIVNNIRGCISYFTFWHSMQVSFILQIVLQSSYTYTNSHVMAIPNAWDVPFYRIIECRILVPVFWFTFFPLYPFNWNLRWTVINFQLLKCYFNPITGIAIFIISLFDRSYILKKLFVPL